MAKAALVVFARTEGREGMGRVANALVTAKEFKETGDEVTIVFDGAGTTWIGTLADASHRYHGAFEEVRDGVAGARSYCADRCGVTEQVEQAGIPLVDEYEQHPSTRRLIADGYQVVTF
ncbi:MAG: DsrE family protein [Thermoleophilia bacterium]|nr:DsrE family protein [Thermoleophilia bacterium]